jgi:hypothetical protein
VVNKLRTFEVFIIEVNAEGILTYGSFMALKTGCLSGAVAQIEIIYVYAPFASLQQKDAQIGVFTETGGKNTACRTSTHNDHIVFTKVIILTFPLQIVSNITDKLSNSSRIPLDSISLWTATSDGVERDPNQSDGRTESHSTAEVRVSACVFDKVRAERGQSFKPGHGL